MQLTEEMMPYLVTIDFETYYDDEYSLTKMTTEEYISHPKFEVLMVSIKVGDEPTVVVDGDDSAIYAYLRALNLEAKGTIHHNAHFDAGILAFHYNIHPRAIFDTRLMSRPFLMHKVSRVSLKNVAEALGVGVKGSEAILAKGMRRDDFSPEQWEKYKAYCANDSDLEWAIFKKLYPHFPQSELELINNSIRWFTKPVLELNAALLEHHLIEIKDAKDKLLANLPAGVSQTELMSNIKFADVLRELGYEPPMKISPTTGDMTYAFAKKDPEFIDFQEENAGDISLEALIAARLGHKSTQEETRTERLLGIARRRGTLPVPLTYWAAHTGRFGGSDSINLQNLKRKSVLRHAIQAPKGHLCVVADQAQVEARVNGWLSGDTKLVDAFAAGDDVYSMFAEEIYGKPINKDDTPDERFVGKQGILGLGYGAAAEKFQIMLKGFGVNMPLEFCIRVVEIYRKSRFPIVHNWRMFERALELMVRGPKENERQIKSCLQVEKGAILLPNGMRLLYPGLHVDPATRNYSYYSKGNEVHIYGAKFVENVVQALSRVILVSQINELIRMGHRVALTVHDEILLIVRETELEAALGDVMNVMTTPPDWGKMIPLDIEVKYATTYGGAK